MLRQNSQSHATRTAYQTARPPTHSIPTHPHAPPPPAPSAAAAGPPRRVGRLRLGSRRLVADRLQRPARHEEAVAELHQPQLHEEEAALVHRAEDVLGAREPREALTAHAPRGGAGQRQRW